MSSRTSSFVIAIAPAPVSSAAKRQAARSSQPVRRGRPVEVPYSLPRLRRYSPVVRDVGFETAGGCREGLEDGLFARHVLHAEGTQQRAGLGSDRGHARRQSRLAVELGHADALAGSRRLVRRADAS